MMSPTSKPPVSRATFQVRPKSLRLICVLASKPMVSGAPGMGIFPRPVSSVSSTTSRVTPNRQVSDHLGVIMALWLDTGAFERDDGIVLDIQEVGGLQVGVATFHARIQGRCVDLHFHRGAGRVSLVKNNGAVDVLEVALHRRKHHVFA